MENHKKIEKTASTKPLSRQKSMMEDVIYYKTREEEILEKSMRDHMILERSKTMKPIPINDGGYYSGSYNRLRYLYKLPFTQTSEINPAKRYYRHHCFNHRIIDYALLLWDIGFSSKKISESIEKTFGFKITYQTYCNWVKKFRPNLILYRGRPLGGQDFKKHGFKRNQVINYVLSLLDGRTSSRKVSKMIKEKFGVKISPVTCWRWAKKLKPNLACPKWRPHDEQWNIKVSAGLKLYFGGEKGGRSITAVEILEVK